MENNLRESFIRTKDIEEQKYLSFIDLEFDYEINKFYETSSNEKDELTNKSVITERLSENFFEKKSESRSKEFLNKLKYYNHENFNDEFAPLNFKCEDVPFYKKNFFKALISNKRSRLINNEFDLDLM